MQTPEICRFLDWDSEHFGLRIASVRGPVLTAESAAAVRAYCAAERIDCMYFLAASDDPATSAAAQDAGFRFVDIRVTLERSPDAPPRAFPSVRPCAPSDLATLREIARMSHSDSRFYADARFPRDASARLFETWIEKSAAGWAQAVWVAECDGRPGGYLTCHVNGTVGSIGLVAVAADLRGRGLGGQLIAAAMDYFRRAGVCRVEVVTQGRNIASQRLYQRCGFLISAVQLWYHYWSPPK